MQNDTWLTHSISVKLISELVCIITRIQICTVMMMSLLRPRFYVLFSFLFYISHCVLHW